MITSRVLVQYIAVAEELHFGKAARRLHISQPPLSQAIRRLEESLGVALLKRTSRTVTLTGAGQVFLREAYRLLEQKESAIKHTRAADAGLAGKIAVGFACSISHGLLPDILARFLRTHPNAQCDLHELPSIDQLQELDAQRIDVGIVRLPLANVDSFATKFIWRERMIVALPRNHFLCAEETIPLTRLAEETFIALPSLLAKTMMSCQAAGFSPRVSMEIRQMPIVVGLVAAGMGIALVPEQSRHVSHQGVEYRALEDDIDHLKLEVALAWRHDQCSITCREFIESIPAALP